MKQIIKTALIIALVPSIGASEISITDVKKHLIGNYRYLLESQIKCDGNFEDGTYICNADTPNERSVLGGWNSHIVPPDNEKMKFDFMDSNVFVTANSILPLYGIKFDDPEMERQRLETIELAMKSINTFRRNDGFAFWPLINPILPDQPRMISPLNISALVVSSQLKVFRSLVNIFPKLPSNTNDAIMVENFKGAKKDIIGLELNVPNDADDTAVAIASNYLYGLETGADTSRYTNMSKEFVKYVDTFETRNQRRYQHFKQECKDIVDSQSSEAAKRSLFKDINFLKNCSLDDEREFYRYDAFNDTYSGAFMTWFFNENADVYSNPEEGLALTGQNSIDCDINANVLYSLGVTGMKNDPEIRQSYENSCNYISEVILDKNDQLRMGVSGRSSEPGPVATWTYCGLFYPAHLTFPYVISRAVEAGSCQDLSKTEDQKRFDLAMKTLAKDLLKEQDKVTDVKPAGTWYESIDGTTAFATQMGAITLLNLQKSLSDKLEIDPIDFKTRIDMAMKHVLSNNKLQYDQNSKTITSIAPEGVFFGGGLKDEAALWKSDALTTSVSMELMTKYLLAFDDNAKKDDSILYITRGHLDDGDYETQGTNFQQKANLKENPVEIGDENRKLPTLDLVTKNDNEYGLTLGTSIDNHGTREAIIGVSMDKGTVYTGRYQSEKERVAYYKVSMNGNARLDLENGGLNSYDLNVRFLGISADSQGLFADEVALLPIRIVHQDDKSIQSVYLAYGSLTAPIVDFGDNSFLDVNAATKLVGVVHDVNHNDVNLAAIKLGFSLHKGNATISLDAATTIGARFGDGSVSSSTSNNSVSAAIDYAFNKNHSLSLSARRQNGNSDEFCEFSDLCVEDDRIELTYRVNFKR